jgi:hypothetical protein
MGTCFVVHQMAVQRRPPDADAARDLLHRVLAVGEQRPCDAQLLLGHYRGAARVWPHKTAPATHARIVQAVNAARACGEDSSRKAARASDPPVSEGFGSCRRDPRAGVLARQRAARALQLLRRARQRRRDHRVPRPGNPPLVLGASAPQPADTSGLGTHAPPRQTMAATRPRDASQSSAAIRRQNPKEEPSALGEPPVGLASPAWQARPPIRGAGRATGSEAMLVVSGKQVSARGRSIVLPPRGPTALHGIWRLRRR